MMVGSGSQFLDVSCPTVQFVTVLLVAAGLDALFPVAGKCAIDARGAASSDVDPTVDVFLFSPTVLTSVSSVHMEAVLHDATLPFGTKRSVAVGPQLPLSLVTDLSSHRSMFDGANAPVLKVSVNVANALPCLDDPDACMVFRLSVVAGTCTELDQWSGSSGAAPLGASDGFEGTSSLFRMATFSTKGTIVSLTAAPKRACRHSIFPSHCSYLARV